MADFPVISSTTAVVTDLFTSTSGTTVTLTTNVGTVMSVFVNGIAQRKSTDWSISGQIVTFVSTLVSDDVIVVYTTSQATLNGNISIVHQEFAAASGTTVTLNQTTIGGVAIVARNGVVQRETTDYTVNYSTGVITFTTTLSSEQVTVAFISGGGGVGNATTVGGFAVSQSAGANLVPVSDANGYMPANTLRVLFSFVGGAVQVQNTTAYYGPNGQGATEKNVEIVIPFACTVKKLYVGVDAVGGSSQSATFTLRKNEADTTLTCAIATGATSASDTAHSATYAAGDRVSLKCVTSATTGNVTASGGASE